MRSRRRGNRRLLAGRLGERGSATAEFAMILPAIVLVFALFVGALGIQLERIQLLATAAEAARSEARGDSSQLANANFKLTVFEDGDFLCAVASKQLAPAALRQIAPTGFSIHEKSCVRANGR